MSWVLLEGRLVLKERLDSEKRMKPRQRADQDPQFYSETVLIKGEDPLPPRQSILGVWSQPAGDMQDRMLLQNISRASQQVAVSWRRAVAGDRTIEPSRSEGSTLGNFLSGKQGQSLDQPALRLGEATETVM